MLRIDHLLIGYVVYTIAEDDIATVAELFLKNGLSIKFFGNRFNVNVLRTKRIEELLATRVKFSRSEIRGLCGFLNRQGKRYGALLAIALCFISFGFLSNTVWDVRIEGSETIDTELAEQQLAEAGLYVGGSWSNIDKSKVEVEFLSISDSVSWVNINRRGTVAYVTIVEKETHSGENVKSGYSNIVASCDAVIEEITVIHGVAAVSPGESVKKGDLLISGVIPTELGGGYCYAEGIVIGRVSDSIEISVENIREEKVIEEKNLYRYKINIFNFSVNIFKSYRNLDKGYAIIEEEENISLLNRRLPVSVSKQYSALYSVREIELSPEEMTASASERMSKQLIERLEKSTLIRIKTDGGFSGTSYTMHSSFVCLEDIGIDLPFGAPEG